MKITVTEALRLKNQIATVVGQVMHENTSYGLTTVDSVVTETGEQLTIMAHLDRLNKVFAISQAVNSALAAFNVTSKISDNVRRKSNIAFLVQVLENTMRMSDEKSSQHHENVGDTRVVVKTAFKPYLTKTAIKDQIKVLKAEERQLMADIDKANTTLIELPFEYEDVEALQS